MTRKDITVLRIINFYIYINKKREMRSQEMEGENKQNEKNFADVIIKQSLK